MTAAAHAVTGETFLAAVIGKPVRHSLSPVIFNAAFAATGLDGVFVALEVDEDAMPAALDGARALGLRGLSVTMPGKEVAAKLVDELTPDAAELGAVNSIRVDGRRLVGHNTDGPGFVDAIRLDEGFEPAGRTALVVGAGGAARAVVRALAAAGVADLAVAGRTASRAERAASLAGSIGRCVSLDTPIAADLVVNATPVGMRAGDDDGGLPFDAATLQRADLVVDLIYHPLETPLLALARERGIAATNGVGMLVHQAGHQFSSWTGQPPPLDAMRAAVATALRG
jgi:shikimate dehydrogenase